MMDFQRDIQHFVTTTVSRAQEAIANQEEATFFIGRKTCAYCRLFATKLANVVKETNAKVYFINSEEPTELNQLSEFRHQYNIPTVPGFLRVNKDQVLVRCDSTMSQQAIKEFMNR